MVVALFPAVLALSRATRKLGNALLKVEKDIRTANAPVRQLAGEVQALSNECDLVYAELEYVATGSTQHYDVDGRMWSCLETQVDECSRTMEEIEQYILSLVEEETNFTGQAWYQTKLDRSEDQLPVMRAKVQGHTDNLRITVLLINMVFTHIAPSQVDRGLAQKLERLQEMVEKLQRSSKAYLQPGNTEVTLMQCAREVLVKGTTMFEASMAAQSGAGGPGPATTNTHVAEWVSTLDSIGWDQRHSVTSDIASNVPSIFSGDEVHTVGTSATSAHRAVLERKASDVTEGDSDDDLDSDLAKAALETGTKAFEAQEWDEAESLLQEVLRILQQLPKKQRGFCDIFGLHYKLAVCAYYTRAPADAEEALLSLVQQSASSDEQRGYIYDATHLLSHLYIRLGQIDRARSECEKVLQARRRLLGKQSDASLESTALMSYIYNLLNNRARAKSCIAMIPEDRRDAVLRALEVSLGMKVDNLECSSPTTWSMSEGSDLAVRYSESRLSASSLPIAMDNRCYGPVPTTISQLPAASPRQVRQHMPSNKADFEDLQSLKTTSFSSTDARSEVIATDQDKASEDYPERSQSLNVVVPRPNEPSVAPKSFILEPASRKEILNKIGCQPKDKVEDSVCDGDLSAFAKSLSSRKGFFRSKMRKRARAERVTALHFAALFGEIDMARCLLASNFDINEIPYGYSTSLTPLKFAIGARQVEMVEFLIANGAKPSDPDSWSTLAGQLMNRSWLMKTISEAEKDDVPSRMIAILKILLKRGWDVNAPFDSTGATVLHQAVGFWTGSYKWDLGLRIAMTSFLCERGADPSKANADGKTPYDLASASDHQDLLMILERGSKKDHLLYRPVEPVELSTERY